MRIIIIGNGGTGKSTLGERLGNVLDLQVTHLDKITFKPGWIRISEDIFRKNLSELLLKEKWIIEGWSYHSTLRERLEAATIIIYLKYGIWTCYRYALMRHIKYSFRQNPYDPENSPILKKTSKMVRAMWKVHKDYEPELQQMLKEFESEKKIFIFENRRKVNEFVGNIEREINSRGISSIVLESSVK